MVGNTLRGAICFLLVVIIATATSIYAQTGVADPPVPASAEAALPELAVVEGPRREVRVGDGFQVSVWLPPGNESDEIELPVLPDGLQIGSGLTRVQRGFRDAELRIGFRAVRAGRYIIEPILISNSFQTPAILVEVLPPGGGVIPFRAEWQVLAERPLVGQSVPVVLRMLGVDDFLFPDSLSYRAPNNGLFEEVSGLGALESREVGGVTLFDIPVAGFVFTPSASGQVQIPPAQIRAQGLNVEAASRTVDVSPASERSPNAVGDVTVTAVVEPTELLPGAAGAVRMTAQGVGNLPVLEFPEVQLDGLVAIDRSSRSEITADVDTYRGYVGERVLEIRFEAAGDADVGTVRFEPFVVFDPLDDSYRTQVVQPQSVRIQTPTAAASDERATPGIDLIPIDRLMRPFWIPVRNVPWVYAFLILGPLGFAAAKLSTVRSAAMIAFVPILLGASLFPALSRDRLERASVLVEDGRYAVAAALYDIEIQEHPWHAGLHFNRGVLALRSENAVDATYHLRRAVRLAPEQRAFRQALRETESFFELAEQPAIGWSIRANLILLVLVIVWSAVWILLSLGPSALRSASLAGAGFSVVILVLALAWAGIRQGDQEAVILRDAVVLRIPDETAQPWLRLGPARAVSVELSFEGFYLVRTSAGVAGWVAQPALWMVDDE